MSTIPQLPAPTWFVGCGNMAGAMVEGWRSAGVDFSNAVVVRPSMTPVEGVQTVTSFGLAGAPPKLVILGFKPQQLDEVAPELKPWGAWEFILTDLDGNRLVFLEWVGAAHVQGPARKSPG